VTRVAGTLGRYRRETTRGGLGRNQGRQARGEYRRAVPVRAAVWDLGSSSFHLLVCEAADHTLTPVVHRRALLNLGLSVGARGNIPRERVTASVAAAKRLRRGLNEAPAELVVALGTAALRDARNGPEVVDSLQRVVGTPIRVLDGEEEARLCFVGQRAGVWIGDDTTLGLDLGGGSLEAAIGSQRHVELATSAAVGPARLRGELGTGDVLSAADQALLVARTIEELAPVTRAVARYGGVARRTVVSGGTVRALARLATARARRWPSTGAGEVNQVELPAAQVAELADQLARLDLPTRLALPGMQARRAPLLPVGAVILSTVASELGVDRFVVSEWGLREGAILDALGHL
jgi:exopolyphosphatase / guanosine-5'-triphosphate,3'-diphosphate pyrophosphatase